MKILTPRVKLHVEFIVMITIFLVFFGIGMYLLSGYAITLVPAHAASSRSMMPTLYMNEQYEDAEVHVNEIVPYQIFADTKGREMNSYQVILELHPSLQVADIKSKVDGIMVTSIVKDGYIIINGSAVRSIALNNDPLFEIKLQPISTGLLMFDVNDQRDGYKTEFKNNGEALPITLDAEGSLSVK
jgi:hypothetical protein